MTTSTMSEMELNNIKPLLCPRCQHFAVYGEIGEACDCCKNEEPTETNQTRSDS